jgi:lactate permease
MISVWPAALTAGLSFAVTQYLVSNYHGPWLVDIFASIASIVSIIVLLKFWQPKTLWELPVAEDTVPIDKEPVVVKRKDMIRAWTPWVILVIFIFAWGVPTVKTALNKISAPQYEVAYLHNLVKRTPPIAPVPTIDKPAKTEEAVFKLNWISATGTGILVAAIIAGFAIGYSLKEMLKVYGQTMWRVRFSLITIAAMLALGYVTKYSGADATLGLALAKTGVLYPFFGTMLGWLGVALTGSDTASNVLFGSLQTITAKQTDVSPILMAAANSSGGVMGKMVDAQSIVVASTATNWYGHEGQILRYVFFHSIALAALVGLLVFLQAYVIPFSDMVVK